MVSDQWAFGQIDGPVEQNPSKPVSSILNQAGAAKKPRGTHFFVVVYSSRGTLPTKEVKNSAGGPF